MKDQLNHSLLFLVSKCIVFKNISDFEMTSAVWKLFGTKIHRIICFTVSFNINLCTNISPTMCMQKPCRTPIENNRNILTQIKKNPIKFTVDKMGKILSN